MRSGDSHAEVYAVLREWLGYRAVVDQAVGILITRLDTGPEAAHAWLYEDAEVRGMSTVALARCIVGTAGNRGEPS
jgi:AmiR/NasT family two-component response regulator